MVMVPAGAVGADPVDAAPPDLPASSAPAVAAPAASAPIATHLRGPCQKDEPLFNGNPEGNPDVDPFWADELATAPLFGSAMY